MFIVLQVVTGLAALMALFSLIASGIMESFAAMLALRGKQLANAVRHMIGPLADSFMEHPLYRQMAPGTQKNSKIYPSYLPPDLFRHILLDILRKDRGLKPDEEVDVYDILQFYSQQPDEETTGIGKKIEDWFNQVMDRVSGTYKRRTRAALFVIGLFMAAGFNLDAIQIFKSLYAESVLSQLNPNQLAINSLSMKPDAAGMPLPTRIQLDSLIRLTIGELNTPLGIGWNGENPGSRDLYWWGLKCIGWLLSAFGISLGATFWFDLFKKMVGLRLTGPRPNDNEPKGNSGGQAVNFNFPVGENTVIPKDDLPQQELVEEQTPAAQPDAATVIAPEDDLVPEPIPVAAANNKTPAAPL